MPIHDWSRVSAGVFHAFHVSWLGRLQDALNESILPSDFYALAEQRAGDVEPDVLTLQRESKHETGSPSGGGTLAVVDAPPLVWQTMTFDEGSYVARRRSLAIRSASDDRLVALIEIMSPGNKSSQHAFDQFVDKALACFEHELHLLIVDLHKPTNRDPRGIHGALIEQQYDDTSYQPPPDKKLTLVSYDSGVPLRAYIQPAAVGDVLPEMPMFLDRGRYVNVPLEETYQAAFQGVPRIYKQQLAAS